MHIFRSHIIKNLTAIVVLIFLLLPSVVSLAHSAEKHDHFDHCENKSDTHIHEKQLDCCLCDVTLLNNGVFNISKEIVFIAYQDIPEITIHTQTVYPSIYRTTNSRGPPAC